MHNRKPSSIQKDKKDFRKEVDDPRLEEQFEEIF